MAQADQDLINVVRGKESTQDNVDRPQINSDAFKLFKAYRKATLDEAKSMKNEWWTSGAAVFEMMEDEAPSIPDEAAKKAIAPDASLGKMAPFMLKGGHNQ